MAIITQPKPIFLAIFFITFASQAFAQAPQSINYQAVARDSQTGEPVANEDVFLSAKVRENGPNGTIVYQENHTDVATNAFGLFSLQIGNGDPVQGSFPGIDWSQGDFWLEIDIDIGSGLETLGSMQFVSVPYALYAENTGNVDDADADPQNELVEQLTFNSETGDLTLQQQGSSVSVNITPSENNNDFDPTNELIEEVNFNSETSELSIIEAGISFDVELGSLINDADSDPLNEAITSVQLIGSNLVIDEVESNTVSLAQLIDDADANPENELIDENGLNLSSTGILTINEAGISHSIDLSPLSNDGDWEQNESENAVYVEDSNVGIGTSTPNARLNITESSNTGEELLRIESSDLDPVISVSSERVGVGTDSPTALFDVNGSISYRSTVVSTTSSSNYTVLPDDYIIIIRFQNGGSDPFTVNMPDPATCEGRVIKLTRIGQVGSDNLLVNFGSSTYDFLGSSSLVIDGQFDAHTSFISVGAQGWVRINRL
jgi:hypothetical protein